MNGCGVKKLSPELVDRDLMRFGKGKILWFSGLFCGWIAFVVFVLPPAAIFLLLLAPFIAVLAFVVWSRAWNSVRAKRSKQILESALSSRLQDFGKVEYVDYSVQLEEATGLAIAHGKLYAVHDSHLFHIPVDSIRSWSWSLQERPVAIGLNSGQKMVVNAELSQKAAAADGFRIQTYDPTVPEFILRTSSESVCKRWETILASLVGR